MHTRAGLDAQTILLESYWFRAVPSGCTISHECMSFLPTEAGSLTSTNIKGDWVCSTCQSSLFWRGRGQTVTNHLFCQGPNRGFQLWLHSIMCIFIAHYCIVDYNSVNNSGFAVLCTPSWMSQTQLGSAPENLKELYQTITAYFKAANTVKVFLLTLQLVWALFKILTSVFAFKVWLGFA